MRGPLLCLCAVLAAGFGYALFWGYQQSRALETVRVGSAAQHRDADVLAERLRTSERARSAAEASALGLHEMNPQRLFTDGHAPATQQTVLEFNAAADADPVWGPFYRKLERRRVLARYAPLLDALQVPAGKRQALEGLLVDRAIAVHRAPHVAGPASAKPPAGPSPASIDGQILQLVGADLARQIKEWNSAVYAYGNAPDGPAAQDAVTLKDAGISVTADQLVRLALLHHEVFVLSPAGPGGNTVDPKTGVTPMEERMFERESTVLPPEAVAVLRAWSVEEHRARAALDLIKARFHIENGRVPR